MTAREIKEKYGINHTLLLYWRLRGRVKARLVENPRPHWEYDEDEVIKAIKESRSKAKQKIIK